MVLEYVYSRIVCNIYLNLIAKETSCAYYCITILDMRCDIGNIIRCNYVKYPMFALSSPIGSKYIPRLELKG